jgi:hypothetical protein
MWPTFFLPGLLKSPGIQIIGSANPACATYYSDLVPSVNVPSAAVGDWLLVHVVHTRVTSASLDNIRIDHSSDSGSTFAQTDVAKDGTEWLTIFDSPQDEFSASSRFTFSGLFLRRLSSDDVAATRVFRFRSPNTTGIFCYQAVALRALHPNLPMEMFDNVSNRSRSVSNTLCDGVFPPAAKVNSTDSILWQMVHYQKNAVFTFRGDGYEEGPAPNIEAYKTLAKSGETRKHWWMGLRKIETNEEQNLIPHETSSSTLTDWSLSGVTRELGAGTNFKYTRLYRSAGVPVRNHAYWSKDLVEGEKYTFAILTSGSTSDFNYPFISVVRPSSAEIGGIYQFTSGPGFGQYSPAGIIGSGHGTYWHLRALTPDTDGIPSLMSGWAILHFTAQESGTHEFRYGFADGVDSATDLTHGSAGEVRCRRATLMTGYKQPIFTPTPSGAILGDFGRGQVHTRWWSAPTGTWGSFTQFIDRFLTACINPSAEAISEARLVPWEDEYSSASSDEASSGVLADGDTGSASLVSRTVYPKIDGTKQSYYYELTVSSQIAASDRAGVTVGPINAEWADSDVTNGVGTYWFSNNGNTYKGSTSTLLYNGASWTDGDVIGAEVDYTDEVIRFYKNGVQQGSDIAMYDDRNFRHKQLPTQSVVYWGTQKPSSGSFGFTGSVNLKGPFTYKPSGCVAWDWPFEPA